MSSSVIKYLEVAFNISGRKMMCLNMGALVPITSAATLENHPSTLLLCSQ